MKVAHSENGRSEAGPECARSGKMQTEVIANERKSQASTPMDAFRGGRWTLNAFRGSAAIPPRRTIQGELSLDKVKPVRNDLSDSDLELVAVKKEPETAPSSIQIGSERVPVVKARSFLERVGQLFRRVK